MLAGFRFLVPLIIVFIIFLIAPFALSNILEQNNIDKNVLLWSNALFFVISIISFSIQKKAMANKNPHAFVRSVTGGMMLKMLLCIIAIILYIYASGAAFNKRAVFISLFLYLVYLFTEVMVVMKMNKKQHV